MPKGQLKRRTRRGISADVPSTPAELDAPIPGGANGDYSRLFELSLDMLCVAGGDGYFKRLNPAWQRTLGWPLTRLLAAPFLEFVHPDDRPRTRRELAQLGAGNECIAFENRYRCADGSYRWLQWTATPLDNRRYTYAIARDITDQRRLRQDLLEISDREQRRLGQDLHDGLGQHLLAAALAGKALTQTLATRRAPETLRADGLVTLIEQAIDRTHHLAQGLCPVDLEQHGLKHALGELTYSLRAHFRIACTLEWDARREIRDLATATHLYRITQEAVTNAIKHGRARRIRIRPSGRDGRATLRVHNDGRPFRISRRTHPGMGLRIMEHRAHLIGGSLDIRPGPRARGTVLTCTFPVP